MRSGLLAGLVACLARDAIAQCPDGTPPPCGRPAPAAPARRPDPPLDDRTWIVVPFENVTRAPDIDWLRDASVNLLYLDLSKWTDIKVIDDERVADLMRATPGVAAGGQVSLQSGIAVAKRAGAGRLVMGDLLKVGSRTQLVGKVFDVKTGQRIRTVRQESSSPDSLMGVFGQLARGVLDVAGGGNAAENSIGTQSIGAYRAYVAGVGYMNRWILDSAHTAFERALTLDSTFALAHYKLALVMGWETPGAAAGVAHADNAVRLGGGLPARERTLVKAFSDMENRRYPPACQAFESLIRADSSDVEAWYQLGECSYHDMTVLPQPGDTAKKLFRSSWTTAIRAFRKTLELDPTYHLAFQHIQDAFLANARTGCAVMATADPCTDQAGIYQAYLRRAGDTLLLEPVQVFRTDALSAQAEAARREGSRRQNLADARAAAEAWLAAGPAESRPLVAYGRILLRQGRVEAADSVLRLVRPSARMTKPEAAAFMTDRIEIAIKRGQAALARQLTDTLAVIAASAPGGQSGLALVQGIFGKTAALGPGIERQIQGATPQWVRTFYSNQVRALIGAPADSVFAAEAEFARRAAGVQGVGRAANLVSVTLLYLDPRQRGTRWPAVDTAAQDPRLVVVADLARGDTAAFKRRLAGLDSLGRQGQDGDGSVSLFLALMHLTVRDSVSALRVLGQFRDSWWSTTAMLDQIGPGFGRSGMLWPRILLQLGDLEAAIGDKSKAIDAYRRFVDLWQDADPENLPTVDRAREALRRLGASPG